MQNKEEKSADLTGEKKEEEITRIPLRLVPNESEALEKEMREIFDEDKIVHRHGSAEPEHD
ncbi:MAG: hypothetical protein ACE5F7_04805 [Nitrospiria bacterium]